jgi:hypothetical protein
MKQLAIIKRSVFFSFILIFLVSSCTSEKKATVWVASPWQRVMRGTPPGQTRTADLKAAENEYAPFRIIIHNDGKNALSDVNVTISDLKGSGGEIKSGDIQLYRANYVHITQPSYRTKNPIGWYPDALIPFLPQNKGDITHSQSYLNWLAQPDNKVAGKLLYISAPFVIDTAQNAEVWCDLYVPSGTAPGTYSGQVSVTSGRSVLANIPVNLSVWGFELPKTISMHSNFGKFTKEAADMMGIKYGSKDYLMMENLFDQELIENRAIPGTPTFVWPGWDADTGIVENGQRASMKEIVDKEHFNSLDIPFRYKNDPDTSMLYLADIADWLDSLGLLDMSYIELSDYPNSSADYEKIRTQADMIRSVSPNIKRFCTVQTVPKDPKWGNLYGYVDIWAPLWGEWDEKSAKERLAHGEELWGYTALCQGPEGTPWWQIDMDPLNFRAPLWISWDYNITGVDYWASAYWNNYESLQNVWEAPFYRGDFWGDGVLLYPGYLAGTEKFVPSIRLKLYREAEEDYEYMVLASNKGYKDEVDKIVEGVASSFQNWSHDNNVYEQAREKLAGLILGNK